MKQFRSLGSVAKMGVLLAAMAMPFASSAEEQYCHPAQHRMAMAAPGDRVQWAKAQLDKEAAWIEIKASQQSAWEAYTAASLELMNTFAEHKPMPSNIDAASAMRQHAEHAALFAQRLAKLADATEKLQAVLSEDQQKVLARTVSLHSQFRAEHGPMGMGLREHRGMNSPEGAPKPAPKAPPKPKN